MAGEITTARERKVSSVNVERRARIKSIISDMRSARIEDYDIEDILVQGYDMKRDEVRELLGRRRNPSNNLPKRRI